MATEIHKKLYTEIPSVSVFLESEEGKKLVSEFGAGMTKLSLRDYLDGLRKFIADGKIKKVPPVQEIAGIIKTDLMRYTRLEGRKAVNAAGILLHTGLGRAPYCTEFLDTFPVFGGYSILQTNPETGARCLREKRIEKMLIELTGCEAATVVNNNAAATMLILNTVAEGREAIVSRGQLIEIGGSYRLPDVMERSNAILREVGATNRTHVRDYEAVINENTGAIIHVHTSNYRVRGFSGTPDIRELCELRKKYPEITVVDDLGSGALVSLAEFGLPNEPLVKDSIAAGADIICFSGDKLICGPQAGIICGKKEFIAKIRKNPYARMFRVDKAVIAGLELALIHFINGSYRDSLPFYVMLSKPVKELAKLAAELAKSLEKLNGFDVSCEDEFSYVGSGSIPDEGVPAKAVKVTPKDGKPEQLAKRLRTNVPAIFCRVKDNSLLFDMRTLMPEDFALLKTHLPEILKEFSAG